MFGKRLSEYLRFQQVVLALLAAVGLARLGLSLAGLPDTTVGWLSMNVVGWAGAPERLHGAGISFGAQSQWVHLLSHLTIGIVVPPFLLGGVASLVLLISKRVGRRPAVA